MAAKRYVEAIISELFDTYFNVIPHFHMIFNTELIFEAISIIGFAGMTWSPMNTNSKDFTVTMFFIIPKRDPCRSSGPLLPGKHRNNTHRLHLLTRLRALFSKYKTLTVKSRDQSPTTDLHGFIKRNAKDWKRRQEGVTWQLCQQT